ncbi:hypothetical protein SAMN05216382_2114 [Sphingomonas palmae]|uniref:Uncharacterized protein n=1 Tax=Sphingomonas palmae TaxID=1855283 RepID=A0A1H7R2J9_9SPHN|nr:hypothetical protein [Sphingomonas palmae]SEL54466.1 hypothetical protein SAMN05216382_2114 [Sphingomonas palmae]
MTIWKRATLAAALMLTAQASPAALEGDFCTRLAANAGIERPVPPAPGPTEWTVNALNFGQRFLFSGAVATGVGVTPAEPATAEEYRRMEDICMPEDKGATCNLVGPLNFKFIWKGKKVITPMQPGERATIVVAGTRTTCRSAAVVGASPTA